MSTTSVTHRDDTSRGSTGMRAPRQVAVIPDGELDLGSAHRLEREVRRAHADGSAGVTIDLRRLEFMDSTGLRTLIALRNEAKRSGDRLDLIAGRPEVQRIFALTGTRGLFDWRRDGA